MSKPTDLADHCLLLIHCHDSVRAAAKSLSMDPGYLHRLAQGKAVNPSDATLQKLGLVKVVKTEYWRKGDYAKAQNNAAGSLPEHEQGVPAFGGSSATTV